MSRRSWPLWVALALALTSSFVGESLVSSDTLAASRKGDAGATTLRRTITVDKGSNLKYGPGLERVTRTLEWNLRSGGVGRPLAAFKQLSDVHVVDEESPGRVEWLDGCETPFSAAYRVQEAMSTQIGNAMLKQLAKIKRGPATGKKITFAISTGDNVDNNQENETEWFMKLLNGSRVTPNSGGSGYAGYDRDQFSGALSRRVLRMAQKGFDAVGTKIPWYAVLGNHDGLVQGNAPRNEGFNDISVGDAKVFADIEAEQDCPDGPNDFQGMQDALQEAILSGTNVEQVPADPKRRFLTHRQLIKEYLEGGGFPKGHGLENAPNDPMHDGRGGYYGFKISKRIRGISLDTISYEGVANGHIPDPQFDWLTRELRRYSSFSYVDGKKRPTRFNRNKLIIIYSHHSSASLNNPGADEEGAPYHCFTRKDTPECQDAEGLKGLLQRYPNVIAWVNGHEHNNAVRAQPYAGKTQSERGFWEINTAAHIDWPQQSRVIEVAWRPGRNNNADTIFLYGTTVDHGAPLDPNEENQTRLEYLASVARVESYIDACIRQGQANCEAAGKPKDQNVKLVQKAPFDLGD